MNNLKNGSNLPVFVPIVKKFIWSEQVCVWLSRGICKCAGIDFPNFYETRRIYRAMKLRPWRFYIAQFPLRRLSTANFCEFLHYAV